MLCTETGSHEAIHIEGMSVAEAQDIGKALNAARGFGHGNGEVCIPLVNGLFDRIRITMTSFREKKQKKKV